MMEDKKSFVHLQDKYTKWKVKLASEKQETISAIYDIPINVVNNVIYESYKHLDEPEHDYRSRLSEKSHKFVTY